MNPTIGTEDFDLTPEQHLARAHDLLDPPPRAGDMIWLVENRQVIGGRHAALALLKMAEAARAAESEDAA